MARARAVVGARQFPSRARRAAFDDDWLLRVDVQYHWRNPPAGDNFDDFLAAMDHKHRKNIRQERAKVARAGVSFRIAARRRGERRRPRGDAWLLPADLRRIRQHAGADPGVPAPSGAGGRGSWCCSWPNARRADRRRAVPARWRHPVRPLLGRGETLPGLHFETCYYQGIDYCLREGLARFEPGAQGEHKLARGFLPDPGAQPALDRRSGASPRRSAPGARRNPHRSGATPRCCRRTRHSASGARCR